MKGSRITSLVGTFAGALGFAGVAGAVPVLQLDIGGGHYVGGTEQSIVTDDDAFTLYAYGRVDKVDTDPYYLSVAVLPQIGPAPSSIGSFAINGTSYTIDDLVYGNPPIDSAQLHDGKDLSPHSVFPTYFLELSFLWDSNQRTSAYNTQYDAGAALFDGSSSGGMYYQTFDIDVSGLLAPLGLHFDLYSTETGKSGDVDIDKAAPFSHDAATIVPPRTSVPEPGTLSLLALGLIFIGFGARRRAAAF